MATSDHTRGKYSAVEGGLGRHMYVLNLRIAYSNSIHSFSHFNVGIRTLFIECIFSHLYGGEYIHTCI